MMILIPVLLAVISTSINAATLDVVNSSSGLPSNLERQLHQTVVSLRTRGTSICFAIEGSNSISPEDFDLMKKVVVFTASLVSSDGNLQLAAVKYGNQVSPVSQLTRDVNAFITSVNSITQGNESFAFLQPAVRFCRTELMASKNSELKVIILGDGIQISFGSPVGQLDDLREDGVVVSVVAPSSANDREVLRLAGGDRNLVFDLNNLHL